MAPASAVKVMTGLGSAVKVGGDDDDRGRVGRTGVGHVGVGDGHLGADRGAEVGVDVGRRGRDRRVGARARQHDRSGAREQREVGRRGEGDGRGLGRGHGRASGPTHPRGRCVPSKAARSSVRLTMGCAVPIVVPGRAGPGDGHRRGERGWRGWPAMVRGSRSAARPSRRASMVRSTARSSPSAALKRGRLTLSVQFGGSDGQRRGEGDGGFGAAGHVAEQEGRAEDGGRHDARQHPRGAARAQDAPPASPGWARRRSSSVASGTGSSRLKCHP